MNCRLVFSNRSQIFHNIRFFSNQAKLCSTIQRLGIIHRCATSFSCPSCPSRVHPKSHVHSHKCLARVAAIAQHIPYLLQTVLAVLERNQATLMVGHVGGCHRNGMRQPQKEMEELRIQKRRALLNENLGIKTE